MAKNEVGEFELVLGNRQLLSVFFIVVTLLGVFFFMGYIVGRNSTPGSIDASNRKPADKSTIIDSPAAPAPTQVAGASEPAPEPKPVPPPKEEKPVVEPAPAPHKVEEKKPEPPKEEKKKEEKKEEKKEKKPVVEPANNSFGAPPAGGTYLQLAAVPKSEAELLISVLHKKGFSATSGPGPTGTDLYRVLVGPLTADSINSTRSNLTDAGWPGAKAIVRKY